MAEPTRTPARWALAAATRILVAAGVEQPRAELAAGHLVSADVRGVDTHGLVRLPVYLARARRGELEANAEPTVVRDFPGGAVLDGGDGLGQVAAHRAMELAIEKARHAGVAGVAVRNSGHFGAAASFSMMAAAAGCVGIAATNTFPLLPAVGGASRVVGNNPLSIASPSRLPFPVVLDIAMSQVAAGKLRLAAAAGQPIPRGWAFDSAGNPTTDPQVALFSGGLLRPIADHKGFGLALMIEILTGALAGGGVGSGVVGLDGPGYANVSHHLLALRVEAFLGMDDLLDRVDQLVDQVRGGNRRTGVDRLLVPGELEWETSVERERDGIPYPRRLLDELHALAAELGAALPASDERDNVAPDVITEEEAR